MNFLKIVSSVVPEIDQRWGDIWSRNGFYIQKNVVTGEHRLINDSDEILTEGSYTECLNEAIKMAPRTENSNHAVVILHGIGRTKNCMKHYVNVLNKEGFTAINVSYPSLFCCLASHGVQIRQLIHSLDNIDTVSFIGYSLGGLVTRQVLSSDVDFNIGRVVQIGTPNQGATMADICKDMYSFKYLAGECGQVLRTDKAIEVKPLSGEFGIIAGGTGMNFGFNPILRGDNDGLVKVSETHMDGARDFLLVKSDHHFLPQREETIKATVNFLKGGRFSA